MNKDQVNQRHINCSDWRISCKEDSRTQQQDIISPRGVADPAVDKAWIRIRILPEGSCKCPDLVFS